MLSFYRIAYRSQRDTTYHIRLERRLKAFGTAALQDFCGKFTHETSSDVEINYFYSELKVLQGGLLDYSMSAPEILKFIMDVNCYPNVLVAYRTRLTLPCDYSFG
jgi:hypothetical protein